MATLNLDRVWINLVPDGTGISGYSDQEKDQGFKTQGEVRTYASGRRRAVSVAGEAGELPITLMMVDRTTKDLLRTWVGRSIQVRDIRGQKWFGVFFDVAAKEYMDPGLYAVSITVMTTTVTEGV